MPDNFDQNFQEQQRRWGWPQCPPCRCDRDRRDDRWDGRRDRDRRDRDNNWPWR